MDWTAGIRLLFLGLGSSLEDYMKINLNPKFLENFKEVNFVCFAMGALLFFCFYLGLILYAMLGLRLFYPDGKKSQRSNLPLLGEKPIVANCHGNGHTVIDIDSNFNAVEAAGNPIEQEDVDQVLFYLRLGGGRETFV